jgi:hypothetical protein
MENRRSGYLLLWYDEGNDSYVSDWSQQRVRFRPLTNDDVRNWAYRYRYARQRTSLFCGNLTDYDPPFAPEG